MIVQLFQEDDDSLPVPEPTKVVQKKKKVPKKHDLSVKEDWTCYIDLPPAPANYNFLNPNEVWGKDVYCYSKFTFHI